MQSLATLQNTRMITICNYTIYLSLLNALSTQCCYCEDRLYINNMHLTKLILLIISFVVSKVSTKVECRYSVVNKSVLYVSQYVNCIKIYIFYII